jgi:glyoxylase-like metal-dependent hydrolase (beta-lactamase superfamily II)
MNPADDLPDDVPSIDPETLWGRLRSDEPLTVVDLRDRDEFEQWRLEGPAVESVQLPYYRVLAAKANDELPALFADLGIERDAAIVAVCGRGDASQDVAADLDAAGYDARNLAGGMDAWAQVYRAREVTAATLDDGSLVQYHRPSTGCLSYLVVSEGEAAVVDPLRAFADRYAADAAARGATLVAAVDTHLHSDHLSGVRAVADATGATPVYPAASVERGLVDDVQTVADGDSLAVGGLTLDAVHVPGHTTDSTGFRVGDVFLSGDTLFLDGVGRPDLEAGTDRAATLARSLHETLADRVLSMPAATLVAPGHVGTAAVPSADGGFVASLATLRDRLDALAMDESTFVEYVLRNLPPRPANDETILSVNMGLESVDEETAFELELGPNNCAVSA